MAFVRTTTGTVVHGRSDKTVTAGELSLDEAAASAKDRNERAVELGIKTRYKVVEA